MQFQTEILVIVFVIYIQQRYLANAVNYCPTNSSVGKKLILYYFLYDRKSMLHPITCTSDLEKTLETNTCKVSKKDPGKIEGGVAFTRYLVPICFGIK